MIFTTDSAGTLVFLGAGWGEITGQTAQEAARFGWVSVVHPEDRVVARGVVAEAIAARRAFNLRYRLIGRGGRTVWVESGAMPRHDPDGHAFLGFLGTVSERCDRPTGGADGTVGHLCPAPAGLPQGFASGQEIAAEHILRAQALATRASGRSVRQALELAAFEVGRHLVHDAAGVPSRAVH